MITANVIIIIQRDIKAPTVEAKKSLKNKTKKDEDIKLYLIVSHLLILKHIFIIHFGIETYDKLTSSLCYREKKYFYYLLVSKMHS